MQYHNFEKDMMLTDTQCMTRAWRAHKAYISCLKWHIKMAYVAIFSLYKVFCLGASKCIRLGRLKLCIIFLNILVCCKQQGVKRWRQNVQGGFPVKKSRAECFPLRHSSLMDSMDLTSLKSVMYNYKSNFGVTHVFSASSDTQAHVHTPGKLCITLGHFIFFTILSMFIYDLVDVTWLQYELYWLRCVVKSDGHQYS